MQHIACAASSGRIVGNSQFRDLPFSYELLQSESGRRPVGFRFSQHIVNIKARISGREIIVCGEADSREVAEAKAFSELIERSALLDFGADTSNGWAAHPDRTIAKSNAILELVERDAVLAHWYTSTPFLEIQADSLPEKIQKWAREELSRSEFPDVRILLSTRGFGPSITCLLMNKDGFGVSAHGTRLALEDSIDSAIGEACRAAHSTLRREYWKDSIKLRDGLPGLVDPGTHAVYYAYHEKFPDWMFGQHICGVEADRQWQARIGSIGNKLDEFTYQSVLDSPLYVGFAKHPQAFALEWMSTDRASVARTEAAKRLNLTTETIYGKPHIVS
jgi:hypothetical protein